MCIAFYRKPIAQQNGASPTIWDYSCRVAGTWVNALCLIPSHTGWWNSTYLPRGDGRLCWHRWLAEIVYLLQSTECSGQLSHLSSAGKMGNVSSLWVGWRPSVANCRCGMFAGCTKQNTVNTRQISGRCVSCVCCMRCILAFAAYFVGVALGGNSA